MLDYVYDIVITRLKASEKNRSLWIINHRHDNAHTHPTWTEYSEIVAEKRTTCILQYITSRMRGSMIERRIPGCDNSNIIFTPLKNFLLKFKSEA